MSDTGKSAKRSRGTVAEFVQRSLANVPGVGTTTNVDNRPKAIFVTGAAGFIGSSLSESILDSSDLHVVGVDNFHAYYPRALKEANLARLMTSDRFHFFEGSFEDTWLWKWINQEFQIQTVIHLAAFAGVRPSLEDPLGYYENNVTRTLQLLENMRKSDIRDLIFTSSSSVYGGNEQLPFKEEHATDRPISPYAATKKSGEEIVNTYCHLYGFRALSYRLFTVYGPRQRPDLAIRKFLMDIHQGRTITLFGDGSSRRDYTYISDVVSAYRAGGDFLLGQKPGRHEVLNICSGRTVTLLDMVQTVESALRLKAKIEFAPHHPADLETTLGDLTKANQLIGYSPKVSFQDGVENLAHWLDAHPQYRQNRSRSTLQGRRQGLDALPWNALRDRIRLASRVTYNSLFS